MSVYKREGQSVYSYDFRYRGARFSGKTECTTRREAERVEADELAKAKAQTAERSKPMTFAVASSLYWDEKGKFLANSNDLERYLAWLQKQIGKSTLISAISDATIASAVAKRRGEDVAHATVNRSVTQPMRAILRRSAKTWKQSVQDIEWKDHFLKEPQERVREASADEERTLHSTVRSDYLPALRFAILTGCRRAEIVGLKWHSVDFFNREFTVLGKGDQRRTLPMTKPVRALLWSLKNHHPEAVFTYVAKRPRESAVRGERQPITMEGFKTEWRRTKKRAGLVDFRFHDTRHTAATRLVRKTGNLKLAQEMLGHSDLATTSRYAHVTKNDLRAGMEAANATENTTEVVVAEDNDLETNENMV